MSGDATRWRDLRLRVISAAVLAPTCLLCVWLGGGWFLGLVVVGLAAMGWEWRGMCGARRSLRPLGVLYILPGGLALLWLRNDPVAGLGNVMFVLLVVWSSDIGAYLLGRLAGGPKLAPMISPGKTWSGALGGLLAVLLVGWGATLFGGGAAPRAMAIALLLGVAAQLGDLLESAIKRGFGVKDSGWLIPGHGGVLDRVDAILTAAPVAALIGMTMSYGGAVWR